MENIKSDNSLEIFNIYQFNEDINENRFLISKMKSAVINEKNPDFILFYDHQ